MAQLGSKWLSSAGSAILSRAVASLADPDPPSKNGIRTGGPQADLTQHYRGTFCESQHQRQPRPLRHAASMRLKVVYDTAESIVSQPEDINEIQHLRLKVSRVVDVNDEINQEQKFTTKQIRRKQYSTVPSSQPTHSSRYPTSTYLNILKVSA